MPATGNPTPQPQHPMKRIEIISTATTAAVLVGIGAALAFLLFLL